jgi:hypothetical protein
MPFSEPNLYRYPAGPDLDALIQSKLFCVSDNSPVPPYSSDEATGRLVERKLRSIAKTKIVTGKSFKDLRWFARYGEDPSTATEVLADTYPLAVCRLALIYLASESRGEPERNRRIS